MPSEGPELCKQSHHMVIVSNCKKSYPAVLGPDPDLSVSELLRRPQGCLVGEKRRLETKASYGVHTTQVRRKEVIGREIAKPTTGKG
jgi:hypothetical protein